MLTKRNDEDGVQKSGKNNIVQQSVGVANKQNNDRNRRAAITEDSKHSSVKRQKSPGVTPGQENQKQSLPQILLLGNNANGLAQLSKKLNRSVDKRLVKSGMGNVSIAPDLSNKDLGMVKQ